MDQDGEIPFEGQGYVELSARGPGLPPAPHAPTQGPVWNMFAATVRHVLKVDQYGDEPYIVAPFAMIGMSVPLVFGEISVR